MAGGGHVLAAPALARTTLGERDWAVQSFMPNTDPGVGGHLVMPQDSRLAEAGLGWAESSDLGRGAICGDVWGRNSTPPSLWW